MDSWDFKIPTSSEAQIAAWTVSVYVAYCCTVHHCIICSMTAQDRVQFFIDVVDLNPDTPGNEFKAIINRFPIDLELQAGANFTERTTYTGIYNITDLGFDMSFKVQCDFRYHGPNCTTFCEPEEGYTCDSEGVPVLVTTTTTNSVTMTDQTDTSLKFISGQVGKNLL